MHFIYNKIDIIIANNPQNMKNCLQFPKQTVRRGNIHDLWRKIGHATTFSPQNFIQKLPTRYETSLQLQLSANNPSEMKLNKDISYQSVKRDKTIDYCHGGQNIKQLQKQFANSNIKITQSIYQIQLNPQNLEPKGQKLCSGCLKIVKPLIEGIYVKMKQYAKDYIIMKEDFMAKLKNTQMEIVELGNKAGLGLQYKYSDFLTEVNKLEDIQQKLGYVEKENQRRCQEIQMMQSSLNQLKKKCKTLNNFYLNLKLSSITEVNTYETMRRSQHSSDNPTIVQIQSNAHIKYRTQRNEKSIDGSLQQSDLTYNSHNERHKKQLLNSSQEIQNIKSKLAILKNKLNRRSTVFY